MQRRTSAPRRARRAPSAIDPEKKARVLAEVEKLKERARRGETPEEIIGKGRALARIKELQPWRYEDDQARVPGKGPGKKKRGFKHWVADNLPYQVARANEYIRIALNIRRELVAGRRVGFDALLAIAAAPPELHEALIAQAEAGATPADLRRQSGGEKAADGPLALARKALRLQAQLGATLGQLAQAVQQGGQVPDEMMTRIEDQGRSLHEVTTSLRGPKVDPMGSTSVDLAPLCQEYQPKPLQVKPLRLDIPETWDTDWYERKVLAPRPPDPIILNAIDRPVQSGTLGRTAGGPALGIGISLDGPIRACFLGDTGAAPDLITHMALDRQEHLNHLMRPRCAIFLHPPDSDPPAILSQRYPNRDRDQVLSLLDEYGAMAQGLSDVLVLAHPERVLPLRREYPDVACYPLLFEPALLAWAHRPSRLVVVDLRGPWRHRRDALIAGTHALHMLTQPADGLPLLLRIDDLPAFLEHRPFGPVLARIAKEAPDLSYLLSAPDPRALPPSLLRRAGLLGLGPALPPDALPWLARAVPALPQVNAAGLAARDRDHLLLWSEQVYGGVGPIIEVRPRPPAAWRARPPG